MSTRYRLIQRLILILMSIILVFQINQVYQALRQDLTGMRANIGQHGLWRSAFFHSSLEFANYVQFLNTHIPEDARVVLVSTISTKQPISRTPTMQFFLAPREVINCLDEACVRSLEPKNTVVLLNDTNQVSWFNEDVQIVSFSEEWNIAILDSALSMRGTPLAPFKNLVSIGLAMFWPILWLSLISFSGAAICRRLFPNSPWTFHVSLGIGLGMAFLSIGTTLFWLAQIPITTYTLAILSIVWLICGIAALLPILLQRQPIRKLSIPKLRVDPWLIIFLLVFGISIVVSTGRGFSVIDEVVLWGAKARGIAASGGLAVVTSWGTNTLAYPLHLPVNLANMELLFGIQLPASKLLPAFYALALALLVYSTWVQWAVPRPAAGLASLILLLSGLWFQHSTLAYANLILAYYLAAAVLLLIRCMRIPEAELKPGQILMSGLFFGATAWVRPEGLILAVGCLMIVLATGFLTKTRGRIFHFRLKHILILCLPLIFYTVFWLILYQQVYAGRMPENPILTKSIESILSGNWRFESLIDVFLEMIKHVFDLQTWGFWTVLILILIGSIAIFRKLPSQSILLALSGLVCMLIVLGIYYLSAFDPQSDLSYWINTGLDRMLMPALLLLYIFAVSSLGKPETVI